MFLNFNAILASLGTGAAARIANAARVPGDYLFNQFLPEENRFSYSVEAGNMTVRATMAGLASMDSPYPPGGAVTSTTFAEKTLKIANQVPLTEQTLRAMQDMAMRLMANRTPTNRAVAEQVLNFLDKIIIQPHLDTAEWLRGKALVTGAIDWVFGQVTVAVDYGVPVGNFLTNRTGTASYGGSASAFWSDILLLKKKVRGVRAFIAHPNTIDLIRYNTVNSLVTINEGAGAVTFRKVNADGIPTQDTGDVITLISYDKEADVLDPANPDTPLPIQFMPDGKILAIGNNTQSGFAVNVGQGGTENPDNNNRLGYTHIAPTTEGDGQPGRWSDLFVPQDRPWSFVGRAVTNLLPVIEAPTKIAVASTNMSP